MDGNSPASPPSCCWSDLVIVGSSAKFYKTGIDEFGFMTHHNEI
jgi:hypothetical protein